MVIIILQVNLKIVNCGGAYRDCIKEMETRPGCRVHAIYFTELHVDNNNMTRMPCLIVQYKPYIVEQSCMGASCSFVCVKGQ